jgi:hypothetical protein
VRPAARASKKDRFFAAQTAPARRPFGPRAPAWLPTKNLSSARTLRTVSPSFASTNDVNTMKNERVRPDNQTDPDYTSF